MNARFSVSSCLTGLAFVVTLGCSSESDDGNQNPGGSGGGAASGGSGGGAASGGSGGGSAGSAGTGACNGFTAAVGVIDDLEDGDNAIKLGEPFKGYWYAYNDGTGAQIPTAGDPFVPKGPGSMVSPLMAACTNGAEFIEFGAGLGFNFVDRGKDINNVPIICPVNGTGVTGVKFEAKGVGNIRLQVARTITTGKPLGGTCDMPTGCDYHANAPIVGLNKDTWQSFTIPFSTLDKGGAMAWDASDIVGLQFQAFDAAYPAAAPIAFDFCVDDVSFY